MLDAVRAHLETVAPEHRFNKLREYLQRMILQGVDDTGYRPRLAFVGGTALRIIYGTGRFSEDLDFSLVTSGGYDTGALNKALLKQLTRAGLVVDSSVIKDEKTVASFFLRFKALLAPLGLSLIPTQKLSIKFEVVKRPPAGGVIEETLLQDPIVCLVNHYDLPSLFATKLHAFLFRRYDKGRDYYDLFYFLGKKIQPALKVFQNAVHQTHPDQSFPNLQTLFTAVEAKIRTMDEKAVLRDVHPFLLNPAEERFVSKALLLKSIQQAQNAH